ncbi:MAG: hypothetical protein FWE21_01730 [Defluviitaleaceae bacterium]|nr:hypothetical protein [Defluviitaleaceae bacterium]
MKTTRRTIIFQIVISGLLIAIGVLIPMVSPLRIVIPPASYTLGVHIPIFVAMFISPKVAVAVTIGTTAGFFLGGFPIVIVLRAASHIFFALPGAIYLAKFSKTAASPLGLRMFSLVVALVHGISEAITVIFFFMGTNFPEGQGMLWIIGFIGFGSVLHSLFDFEMANLIRRPMGL